jgi:hypothetical protein
VYLFAIFPRLHHANFKLRASFALNTYGESIRCRYASDAAGLEIEGSCILAKQYCVANLLQRITLLHNDLNSEI